jgi:hypothetical protein
MTPPPPPGPPMRVERAIETFTGPRRFDLEGWADYKSYTGGFNRKGQYTVNSIMPYGGINRVVGEGSFEATLALDNLSFHAGFRGGEISLGFKDKLGRTVFMIAKEDHLGLLYKDNEADDEGRKHGGRVVSYSQTPKSLKMKFIWDEEKRQVRIFYGLDGAEATTEAPKSKAGMYMTSPFSESNAVYFLMTDVTVDIDHFEIKPIGS